VISPSATVLESMDRGSFCLTIYVNKVPLRLSLFLPKDEVELVSLVEASFFEMSPKLFSFPWRLLLIVAPFFSFSFLRSSEPALFSE